MAPNQEANTLAEPLLASDDDARSTDQSPAESTAATAATINKNVTFPSWLCCGRSKAVNHNVLLNLLSCVFYGVSASLWNGTANAAYLKKLGHDRNSPLGNIEAVSGLSSLLAALPVGYLADKFERSRIIAFGGWLMFFTSIIQIVLLTWIGTDEFEDEENDFLGMSTATSADREKALWIYGLVMAFWGVCDGVLNGPAQALYADSTAEGERSTYYTYLFACYIGASSIGPIVSIVLFQTLGDTWDMYHLRMILYVGLGIGLCNVPIMLLFDDKKSLEEVDAPASTLTSSDSNGASNANSEETQEAVAGAEESITADQPCDAENATTAEAPVSEATAALRKHQAWIPYIIFIQSFITAMGSGMTVKFFPLFFKDEVGMTPSQVQIIYVCVPVVMILASNACSAVAKCIGRVQSKLIFSTAGVSCLYSMVLFKSYLDAHPFILVPVYVVRTSLMNGSYPLEESILMDFVPKAERARWKSLDSIAVFGWCGSAAFGGWLSDKYDYTYTFLITAIVQSTGILIFSTLLPLVPRKEGSRDHEDTDAVAVNNDDNDDGDGVLDVTNPESLSEPLLNETSVE